MTNSCLNVEVGDTNVDHRKEMIEGVTVEDQREVTTEGMEAEGVVETDMMVSVIQSRFYLQLDNCVINHLQAETEIILHQVVDIVTCHLPIKE